MRQWMVSKGLLGEAARPNVTFELGKVQAPRGEVSMHPIRCGKCQGPDVAMSSVNQKLKGGSVVPAHK